MSSTRTCSSRAEDSALIHMKMQNRATAYRIRLPMILSIQRRSNTKGTVPSIPQPFQSVEWRYLLVILVTQYKEKSPTDRSSSLKPDPTHGDEAHHGLHLVEG